jgi:hypothetical protein
MLSVTAFHPEDLPLEPNQSLDGYPCGADPMSYRRPDQVPQFPVPVEAANCTVRQAILWCYNQPKWFSQIVQSCTVRFPPNVKTFVLKAPIVFDTRNLTRWPLKLVLDGSGTTIKPASTGISSFLFATNVAPTDLYRRRRLLDEDEGGEGQEADLSSFSSSSSSSRGLAVAKF